MKVKELIAILEKFGSEDKVYVRDLTTNKHAEVSNARSNVSQVDIEAAL